MKLLNGARKAGIALAAAIAQTAIALGDGEVTALEGCGIALAFLGALGVYRITNKEG